jgi:hypothetical protein
VGGDPGTVRDDGIAVGGLAERIGADRLTAMVTEDEIGEALEVL